MPKAAQSSQPPRPVTINVRGKGQSYRIATADLKTIASQLRGKSGFSVFVSVIIPIVVAIITAIATTAITQYFQYVSWRNSTGVQEAQDVAARAQATYDRTASAIAERSYATLLFIGAVTDLANRKTEVDSNLYRLDQALNIQRFERYYEQIKRWNESIDQTIWEIDFHLDRPVGISERLLKANISKIDCGQMMVQQMIHNRMEQHSLKLQFGIIRNCLAAVHDEFSSIKDQAVIDKAHVISPEAKKRVSAMRDHVVSMANEFRCFAVSRIQFLQQRPSFAVYLPKWLEPFGETAAQRAANARQEHFAQSDRDCKFD